ncbi:MAG: hypothetical protein R3B48_15510 [Kofleriaceae bacterium]
MAFAPALPHGSLTKVIDGIHVIRGTFRMGLGLRIGRTMTVVGGADGLTVINSVRLTPEGERELEQLGPVRHVIKLSDAHGIDDPYYVDRYKAKLWALEGARLPVGLEATPLGPDTPLDGAVVLDYPGIAGGRECGLWLPAGGGTLVTCDALQNHDGNEQFASWFGKVMTPILGFKGGVIVAPMWRKIRKVSGESLRAALAPLGGHAFANLVTAHGPPVVGGADKIAREAIERAASE